MYLCKISCHNYSKIYQSDWTSTLFPMFIAWCEFFLEKRKHTFVFLIVSSSVFFVYRLCLVHLRALHLPHIIMLILSQYDRNGCFAANLVQFTNQIPSEQEFVKQILCDAFNVGNLFFLFLLFGFRHFLGWPFDFMSHTTLCLPGRMPASKPIYQIRLLRYGNYL